VPSGAFFFSWGCKTNLEHLTSNWVDKGRVGIIWLLAFFKPQKGWKVFPILHLNHLINSASTKIGGLYLKIKIILFYQQPISNLSSFLITFFNHVGVLQLIASADWLSQLLLFLFKIVHDLYSTSWFADLLIQRYKFILLFTGHQITCKIQPIDDIYKYKTDCLYLMPLFHERTAIPISTKFCTDLNTNPGKVLNTRLTWPYPTPRPGWYPKLQNLNRTLEKKL